MSNNLEAVRADLRHAAGPDRRAEVWTMAGWHSDGVGGPKASARDYVRFRFNLEDL